MAANSKREQIILADVALIEQVTSIKTVRRSMQMYSQLEDFTNQQFPVAAIVGRLPVPDNHIIRQTGHVDYCVSELRVDIYIYFVEADIEQMDTEISNMVDDLWAKLYTDPTRGGVCITTTVSMDENVGVLRPYAAFNLIVSHQYQHTIGGI